MLQKYAMKERIPYEISKLILKWSWNMLSRSNLRSLTFSLLKIIQLSSLVFFFKCFLFEWMNERLKWPTVYMFVTLRIISLESVLFIELLHTYDILLFSKSFRFISYFEFNWKAINLLIWLIIALIFFIHFYIFSCLINFHFHILAVYIGNSA